VLVFLCSCHRITNRIFTFFIIFCKDYGLTVIRIAAHIINMHNYTRFQSFLSIFPRSLTPLHSKSYFQKFYHADKFISLSNVSFKIERGVVSHLFKTTRRNVHCDASLCYALHSLQNIVPCCCSIRLSHLSPINTLFSPIFDQIKSLHNTNFLHYLHSSTNLVLPIIMLSFTTYSFALSMTPSISYSVPFVSSPFSSLPTPFSLRAYSQSSIICFVMRGYNTSQHETA
jgi:hypothetical protein